MVDADGIAVADIANVVAGFVVLFSRSFDFKLEGQLT